MVFFIFEMRVLELLLDGAIYSRRRTGRSKGWEKYVVLCYDGEGSGLEPPGLG